jgi:hypothetical protein
VENKIAPKPSETFGRCMATSLCCGVRLMVVACHSATPVQPCQNRFGSTAAKGRPREGLKIGLGHAARFCLLLSRSRCLVACGQGALAALWTDSQRQRWHELHACTSVLR